MSVESIGQVTAQTRPLWSGAPSFKDAFCVPWIPYLDLTQRWNQAALHMCGTTLRAQFTYFQQSLNTVELIRRALPAYYRAEQEEIEGIAVPREEQMPDFAIAENMASGRIPSVAVSSEILASSAFSRVWNFDHVDQNPSTPTVVIIDPHSGTGPQDRRDLVLSYLSHCNVRFIEHRDAHYLPKAVPDGLSHTTRGVIEVLKKNPHSHLVVMSQSGTTGTIATAYLYQTLDFPEARPETLAIIGSPMNPHLDPERNWLAEHSIGEPLYITIGPAYIGAGRKTIPDILADIFLYGPTLDNRVTSADGRCMTEEHIRDTLDHIFRHNRLANGTFIFDGVTIDPSFITCPLLSFSGAEDTICSDDVVRAAHDMMPNARFHHHQKLEGATHHGLIEPEALTKTIVPAHLAVIEAQRLNQLQQLHL